MLTMARTKRKLETVSWGRATESQFDAMYAPDGTVSAITIVVRDVQARKMERDRLSLLNKLGTLAGTVDYDEIAVALAHVPIPELTDWCSLHIIHDKKIIQRFIAQRDPAKLPPAMRSCLPFRCGKGSGKVLNQWLSTPLGSQR